MNAPLPVIESAVVMPSIGDDVLFQLNGLKLTSPPLSILSYELPLHAKVVYVWNPTMVNLVVWDHYGNAHKMTSVKFLAPGEDVPPGSTYCELSVIPGELIEGELHLADAAPGQAPRDVMTDKPVAQFPKVSQDDVDAAIVGETYTVLPSGRVTVCELTLKNGFTVRGESAVVFIENFDADIGRDLARKKAVDQVWQLLGYELRSKHAAD